MKLFIFLFLFLSFDIFAFPRADFATFWGGFNRITKFPHRSGEIKKIKVLSLGKEIEIYLSTRNKPSPLFVIYPGVFGEVDHRMVFHMAEELEKMGVHILALPNIAAGSYLGIRKETRSDPWKEEQFIQKEMLETAMKEINPKDITTFNILAESLGVWQAVMVMDVYQRPIKNMVLIWPPYNLGSSLLRFDEELTKSKTTFEECSFWWKWPYAVIRYKGDHVPSDLTPDEEKCYGSYILQGSFIKGIKKVTIKSHEIRNLKLEIPPKTFMGLVDATLRDLKPLLKDDKKFLQMDSWLPVFKKKNIHPIFYSSVDDFLNVEKDWDNIKSDKYFSENLTLYPWGGHSGRAAEPEFWIDLRSRLANQI